MHEKLLCRFGSLALAALLVAGCSPSRAGAGPDGRAARRTEARQADFIERIVRIDPTWRAVLVPASQWASQPSSPVASDAGLFRASVWVREAGAAGTTVASCVPAAIRVAGAVERPAALEWPEGLRLRGAIEQCGGVQDEAGTFVLVARLAARGEKPRVACAEATGGGDPRQDLALQAGDLVVVLRASSPGRAAAEVAPLLSPLRAYLNGELSQSAFPAAPAAVADRR